jgi:RNA polymerase sigma factor (TIGR02999 family)
LPGTEGAPCAAYVILHAPVPPTPADPEDATRLMLAAASGDKEAADRLLPLVYAQLRKAAQHDLSHEAADHTLSATALVHEAYLKLVGPREVAWANRAHFYAAAAEAMRRILLDHARARGRRGGKARPLNELDDVAQLATASSEQIVAVDEAIVRLEGEDPQAAALVRLRFYAGLGVEEAAQALGLSPRTAARLWTYARAVLYRDLSDPS